MNKRVGLFGGSFDPPHLGHQALIDDALTRLNLDEVWIIPVGLPVHRQLSGKATSEQRLSWLAAMFADEPRVRIVDWEINQDKPIPAIATLRRFQAENPGIIPFWLMGMDSFLDMPNWVEYPKHQALCNLAVFTRSHITSTLETKGWKPALPEDALEGAGFAIFMDRDLPDISASEIRQNPRQYSSYLHQDTCKAVLACYASD